MRQKNPECESVRGFFFVRALLHGASPFLPLIRQAAVERPGGPAPYFSTRVMTTCGMPASTNSSPSTLNPCAW